MDNFDKMLEFPELFLVESQYTICQNVNQYSFIYNYYFFLRCNSKHVLCEFEKLNKLYMHVYQ